MFFGVDITAAPLSGLQLVVQAAPLVLVLLLILVPTKRAVPKRIR